MSGSTLTLTMSLRLMFKTEKFQGVRTETSHVHVQARAVHRSFKHR
jgi:hypothetical protein